MVDAVKGLDPPPRTRRVRQVAATRQRIIDTATELFLERGYALTTVERIAERADVAVETVYARFGSKAALLGAVLEPAVVGSTDGVGLLDRPEIARIRATTDQHEQVRLLANFSRSILERVADFQQILALAAAVDPQAAQLQRQDSDARMEIQTAYIDLLLANGPLRDGLTRDDAATTYAALANPANFAFLTRTRGWSPRRVEQWLGNCLTLLLLPDR